MAEKKRKREKGKGEEERVREEKEEKQCRDKISKGLSSIYPKHMSRSLASSGVIILAKHIVRLFV